MIIRSSYRCRTCGKGHTLRLGMGHETEHVYRFPCVECGEEMSVIMYVDYVKIAAWTEEVDNSEPTDEDAGCTIVNLHANFVIPEVDRHSDFAFPHMALMGEIAEKGANAGTVISAREVMSRQNERPYRRPDFDAEWKMLKKAWSLHLRGKAKLAERIMEGASKEFYANDALKDVADWAWRFALFSTGMEYEPKLRKAMDSIRVPLNDGRFIHILEELNRTASDRAQQYFAIIREYFSAWSEFSQVHFTVASGVEVQGLSAKTANFARVQMYYGNAFETFASMVDIFTMINNVLAGRDFDKLQNITLDQYRASDKGKRFDALSQNEVFASICEERDNQLRNASHHRELKYDQEAAVVRFKVGKGAVGEVRELSYAEYLVKCARLHQQIIIVFRLHLLIAQVARISYPV